MCITFNKPKQIANCGFVKLQQIGVFYTKDIKHKASKRPKSRGACKEERLVHTQVPSTVTTIYRTHYKLKFKHSVFIIHMNRIFSQRLSYYFIVMFITTIPLLLLSLIINTKYYKKTSHFGDSKFYYTDKMFRLSQYEVLLRQCFQVQNIKIFHKILTLMIFQMLYFIKKIEMFEVIFSLTVL